VGGDDRRHRVVTVRFVAGRAAALVATLVVASVVIYALLFVAPGDPATLLVGGARPSPAAVAEIHREYHLDDPFFVSYARWVGGVAHGDLGRSLVYRDSVGHLLGGRIGNTLLLVVYAALLILVAGIGSGLLAGLRGGRVGTVVTVSSSVAMAVPTFVVAVVLIAIFSTRLTWFPVFGSGSGLGDKLWHLTLPAVSLAFVYVSWVSRVTQASVRAELRAEHVETARSRGLPEPWLIRRHVLRNASAPILAVSGLTIAGLFAATAVAEQAFGVNGIGALLVDSASKQDLAVVQALSLLMVAAFVVVNTVVDVANAMLDPRLGRPE
jgi:peptide/nickel transport system permease protein